MSSYFDDVTETLAPLPSLKEVIERHGLLAKKSLGQNFILDQNVTDRIVRTAGSLKEKIVMEVGPGPGGLTRSILEANPARVIAVEKDRRCIDALKELNPHYPQLLILHEDALAFDMMDSALINLTNPVKIIANLPYNVGTPLLIKWLQTLTVIESMTLMFQKEVAERITAKPKTKAYGRLSILVQWLCEADSCFDLPPTVFVPQPKVTSSVVHITPRKEPLAKIKFQTMEALTQATFGQRRKMIKTSLKNIIEDPLPLLKAARIDPNKRPEELTVNNFCKLAELLEESC